MSNDQERIKIKTFEKILKIMSEFIENSGSEPEGKEAVVIWGEPLRNSTEGKEAVEFANEIANMIFEQKYWPYVSPPEHQCEKEMFATDLKSKFKIWKAEAR